MGVRHSVRAAEDGRLVGGGRPLGRAEVSRLVVRRSAAWSCGGQPLGRRRSALRCSRVWLRRAAHGAQVIKQALPQHATRILLRRAARRTTNKYRPLRNGNQNNSSQSSAARTPYTAHCARACAPHLKRFGREKQRIVSKVSEGQKIF